MLHRHMVCFRKTGRSSGNACIRKEICGCEDTEVHDHVKTDSLSNLGLFYFKATSMEIRDVNTNKIKVVILQLCA